LNKKRFLWAFLTSTVLLVFLSSCNLKKDLSSGHNNETINYFYHHEPSSFDYLVSFLMIDSTQYDNFVEGLLGYDRDGNIRGAMAKSWKVSQDNLIYTYQIRKGVKWIQADGSEYDKVKPSDWTAALKYAADSKSQYLFIIQNSIKGLDEYIKGEVKDFSYVGVEADDKKGTLTYTLKEPEPYWNSKLTLSVFCPVNAKFLKAKGKSFGKVAADSILYNGPYILTNYTSKSVISMKANDAYHDKKNVYVKNVNLTYDSDSDPTQQYREFAEENFYAAILKATDASYKKILKKNKDKICYMSENAGTYYGVFNFNRQSYKYTTPNKDKESTHKAIMNLNFRKAVFFSLNLAKINSQSVGEYAGALCVRHSLVPPNFVNVDSKSYGTLLQEKMNALNPDWQKVNFTKDGNNTSYNAELARQYFAKAKDELRAKGVKFPIHLDTVEVENDLSRMKICKSLKQSIEDALGSDNVIYDIHAISKEKMLTVTYNAESSQDIDYDFGYFAGYAPDYRDPFSYLDIFSPSKGGMLHIFGLSTPDKEIYTNSDREIVKAIDLDKYDKLLNKADNIRTLDKQGDRYTAMAEAEACLLDNAYIVPVKREIFPCMLKIKPFSWSFSPTGCGSFANLKYPRWKYIELQDDIVTTKQYEEAQKNFEKRFVKSKVLDKVE
jgi:oligopeptide transport system substrate-binding protein